jgi:hypothetical protein
MLSHTNIRDLGSFLQGGGTLSNAAVHSDMLTCKLRNIHDFSEFHGTELEETQNGCLHQEQHVSKTVF